ncbi:MAG: 6,7-dimethyl-8-ribityllumazine synthase [Nitrospirae bacterium]|nr:MAG: 6,7-dimethyl-8-ribityllumazine synthase [Nitrospira sp. OLB3]MBV6469674.1 6,7-dimethyl-8-ribityllumazine synthase [Nitrospirota bacterium]
MIAPSSPRQRDETGEPSHGAMKIRTGSHDATGLAFGIVASKFNTFVTGRLLTACVAVLKQAGVVEGAIEVVRVPGAFEIPLVARQLARSGRVDAVICLGAVIRGDTPHFEYISTEVSRGILQASLETDVPVVFGVLTTDTVAQATERADPGKLNRGADAARTAIEMANLMKLLRKPASSQRPSKNATRRAR